MMEKEIYKMTRHEKIVEVNRLEVKVARLQHQLRKLEHGRFTQHVIDKDRELFVARHQLREVSKSL